MSLVNWDERKKRRWVGLIGKRERNWDELGKFQEWETETGWVGQIGMRERNVDELGKFQGWERETGKLGKLGWERETGMSWIICRDERKKLGWIG